MAVTGEHALVRAGVITDVLAEYDHAKHKHGENTLDGAAATGITRLAALVEEVGEVAEWMTYDHADPQLDEYRAKRMRKELIQVANVALTWASVL